MNINCIRLLGAIIIIGIYSCLQLNAIDVQPYKEYCKTASCENDADRIFTLMLPYEHKTPCEDFYEYVCVNSDINDYVKLHNYGKYRVYSHFNMSLSKLTDSNVIRNLKKFYKICMDLESNVAPLKDLIEKLGGWSILEGSKVNYNLFKNITEYFRIYKQYNLEPDDFFTIKPALNELVSISDQYQFHITTKLKFHVHKHIQPVPDASDAKFYYKKYYFEYLSSVLSTIGVLNSTIQTKAIEDYMKYSYTLLCAMKIDGQSASIPLLFSSVVTELEDLIDFSQIISSIIYPHHLTSGILHNKISRENIYLKIDCLECLKNILDIFLDSSLNELRSNYIMFRLAIKAAPYISEDLRILFINAEAHFFGEDKHIESTIKSVYCENLVTRCWDGIEIYDYLSRNNLFHVKNSVTQIARNIQTHMLQNIGTISWLDDDDRKPILKKVKNMKLRIGYEDIFRKEDYLNWYYCPLLETEINPSQYWELLRFYDRVKLNHFIEEFLHQNEKWRWDVNRRSFYDSVPYYSYFNNELYVPFKFLQLSLYQEDRPHYMNYAGIGSIIGWEMYRSITGEGRIWDVYSNNEEWMTDKSINKYQKFLECFYLRLLNYRHDEQKYGPLIRYAPDLMAIDVDGVLASYRAYEKFVLNTTIEEEALSPDFIDYNARQMFWIQLVSTLCIRTKTYSKLASARIRNIMDNTKEFSRDWNCKESDLFKVLPKCKLWEE